MTLLRLGKRRATNRAQGNLQQRGDTFARAGRTGQKAQRLRVARLSQARACAVRRARAVCRAEFPALQRLAIDIGAGDGIGRGREATVFSFRTRTGDEAKVAAAICYESLYPAQTAELVRGGAEMLAFITNEGWFSRTHGEYQIAAFSRLRSIETRRATARAANTGITWFIDSLGRVHEQAPWWSEQTLEGRVKLSDEMSLYVRYTDYFPKWCVWLTLAIMAAALARTLRRFVRRLRWRRGEVVAVSR